MMSREGVGVSELASAVASSTLCNALIIDNPATLSGEIVKDIEKVLIKIMEYLLESFWNNAFRYTTYSRLECSEHFGDFSVGILAKESWYTKSEEVPKLS